MNWRCRPSTFDPFISISSGDKGKLSPNDKAPRWSIWPAGVCHFNSRVLNRPTLQPTPYRLLMRQSLVFFIPPSVPPPSSMEFSHTATTISDWHLEMDQDSLPPFPGYPGRGWERCVGWGETTEGVGWGNNRAHLTPQGLPHETRKTMCRQAQ